MKILKESELILNNDGSIYHLQLKPGEVFPTIITVGDQKRAKLISKKLDKILHYKKNREFVCYSGLLKTKRISIVSTGIGTDNIDIVFNEIDALFNIDFVSRRVKRKKTKLDFIRIGTSGCLRKEIPVDSFLVSHAALGLDGLGIFYDTLKSKELKKLLPKSIAKLVPNAYFVEASKTLLKTFRSDSLHPGTTITAAGFYNPQSRMLRIKSPFAEQFQKALLNDKLSKQLTNLEMETAGIYLLAKSLGHRAISLNALLANRSSGAFSSNPQKTIDSLIDFTLEKIVQSKNLGL